MTGARIPFACTEAPILTDAARRTLFERLMLPHRAALNRLAYHFTGDSESAEDLVQEALVRAYDRLETFHPDGGGERPEDCAARSWLYAILRNSFFNTHRTQKRGPKTVSLDSLVESSAASAEIGASSYNGIKPAQDDPARRFLLSAQHTAILEAIAALPDQWRIPILMVDIEGCTYEEVARVMGIPLNTVRSRLHRARKTLQEHLAQWRS